MKIFIEKNKQIFGHVMIRDIKAIVYQQLFYSHEV